MEPNPKFRKQLVNKNRNAWILPHCLSTKPEVEVVNFDAHFYNGGITKEGKVLPSNLGRKDERDESLEPIKIMRVSFKKIPIDCKKGINIQLILGAMLSPVLGVDGLGESKC